MEVNKEEAIRCLHIAQKHRNAGNHANALKFARKSVALYSTPEGSAMVSVVEREIETGGSSSAKGSPAPSSDDKKSSAKATGVEEHVSSARARPGHGTAQAKASSSTASAASAGEEKGKQRTYTSKQIEVVKRIKSYQHHQYYEILSVEKTCSENDVKRAYKKLALALHPDKNGAPGADEAFKMVSKAFQVLSDSNLRAAFDRNPSYDPTQRGGGRGDASRSGFGHPGFSNAGGSQGDLSPEDLFNMFFGGGGMGGGAYGSANVFTFGGPGGFQAQFGGPRRRAGAGPVPNEPASPLATLLPLLLLFAFAVISIIPSIFGGGEDPTPRWSFEKTNELNLHRNTWNKGIDYYVNQAQWEGSQVFQSVPLAKRGSGNEGLHSAKVRQFDRTIETHYIRQLQNQCEYDNAQKQHEISQHTGFLGIGADYDKIRELRAQTSPACEQLRSWGLLQTRSQTF